MRSNTVFIDGSFGEGGGQILRTSLALSCVSGRPVEIVNIRKSRAKPGLQPQHLTAVNAAVDITGGFVEGAALSSTALRFTPGPVSGGSRRFDVSAVKGSAGSVSLVVQTVLLPLCFADGPSTVAVIGGTHVPWSPTYQYLKHVFLPALSRLGPRPDLTIQKWGWYPGGGGHVTVTIEPRREFTAVTITEPGKLESITGISAVSNLPMGIALRQRNRAVELLEGRGISADIGIVNAPSDGKGTLLFLLARFENISAGFDSLGAIGKRAETVADEACAELFHHLDGAASFEPHLADQIVPYLALARGVSEFTTSRVTRHLLTNIWAVRQFLDVDIFVEGREGEPGRIVIRPATSHASRKA